MEGEQRRPARGRGRGRIRSRSPATRSPDRAFSFLNLGSSGSGSTMFVEEERSSISHSEAGGDEASSSSSPGECFPGHTRVKRANCYYHDKDYSYSEYDYEDYSYRYRHRYDDYFVKTRPEGLDKKGQKGNAVEIQTNFYPVKKVPSWTVFRYHVNFTPDEDRTDTRRSLLKKGITNTLKDLGSPDFGFMFDGFQLFTSKRLEDVMSVEPNTPMNFSVQRNDGTEFQMRVRFETVVGEGSTIYIQLYNLLIRKCLCALDLQEMGRNFFDHHAPIPVPAHKLELWPGYVTSMRNHEKDLLLCVEVIHKVIRTDSVLQIIRSIEEKRSALGDAQGAVKKELTNTIVMTTYKRKTYHVIDVIFTLNPMSTFRQGDQAVTYKEYYKTRYGIEINDLRQPLLMTRRSKKDLHKHMGRIAKGYDIYDIILIPELCRSTGLPDDMRGNVTLMKDLDKHLHQGPNERAMAIERFMDRINKNIKIQKVLKGWGLEFGEKSVAFPGRILPKETILFANGQVPVDDKGAFGSQQMLSAMNLNHWAILVPEGVADGIDNLVQIMSKISNQLSMKIANPKQVVKIRDVRIPIYSRELQTVVKDSSLQMVFVVLPNNKADLYSYVKRRLAVEVGIPSQCFLAKNVKSKDLMSIATNVVIQMNAKLGGEPWKIQLPLKNTMFIGFDVYHVAKGKGGSIGATVATISTNFTRYYSTTSVFRTLDELSKTMGQDVAKCVNAYRSENSGEFPESVFLFRDGVGEGQLEAVFDTELRAVKEKLRELYMRENRQAPKLTYIVVTKKINTRLFQVKSGGLENPPPGTVVDDVVTIPVRFDFYLISCAARQGTVSPCSYNVLQDESGLGPDKIQLLTYKLCHMYYNWSGTVAVPAPCQYAHKLAFLTGLAYGGQANKNLEKLIHFL